MRRGHQVLDMYHDIVVVLTSIELQIEWVYGYSSSFELSTSYLETAVFRWRLAVKDGRC
jgi:hypothetical protein